jgi:hypothetical protein
VFTTRSLVDHLADDVDVLEGSRLLKYFVESFCQDPQAITLGSYQDGETALRHGVVRTR